MDKPDEIKLAWTVEEQLGVEICKPGSTQTRLGRFDLCEGDEVLVPGLMGGYHVMTVTRDQYGEVSAKGEQLMAALEFDEDRGAGAWVCVGLINLRGIEKLTVAEARLLMPVSPIGVGD